jgi:hypothetical protein
VADVNRDGVLDILSGPFWYAGPNFEKAAPIYPATKVTTLKYPDGTQKTFPGFKGALSTENEYSDNFLSFSHDFNGDGWPDYLVIGFPGKEAYWYENPKGAEGIWPKHLALKSVDNESPMLRDINGDGRPDLLCTSGGFIGFAEYDPTNPAAEWKWTAISEKGNWQRFTHGIGFGDINGDKRTDILMAEGWWEQPASLEGQPVWKYHEAFWGKGGAQMYGYDVNGDGKTDVITSLEAHGYGVVWFEQTNDNGVIGWTRHTIVGTKPEENAQGIVFSQPHAIDLADTNGDGLLDIVTGKRFWAHGPRGDAEPNAPAVIYTFELQRPRPNEAKFVARLIDSDSGVGTQVMAVDVNGDKRTDVVVGNKKGVFVHIQESR